MMFKIKSIFCVLLLIFVSFNLIILPVQASDEEVTINIYADEYTPREKTQSDRWNPPKYFWDLEEKYNGLQSNVDIEFISRITPQSRFDTWMVTQYKADKGPEICDVLFSEVNRHYQKDWFLNLEPYLNEPNPYVEGNEKWKDIFMPGVLETGTAPDGNIYVIPSGIVGTAIFYNKDIFEEVGVTPPETWNEFIQIQKEIQEAGYIPFAYHLTGDKFVANWSLRVIQDMILDSKLSEIKGVEKEVERTMIEGEGIGQKELVKAIMEGTYSAKDPQWQEQLILLKEWSEYWSPYFLNNDAEDAYRQFITGEAAMLYESSFRVKPIENDELRDFEFDTFEFPRITKESSQYATGISAPAVGGFTGAGSWTVAAKTEDRENLEETIDFLQFITAPDNYIPLANDLGAYAPALKDTGDVAPELKSFVESVEKGVFRIESFYRGLTREYSDQFYKNLQQYMADRKSLEEVTDEIQNHMDQAAENLVEEHDWDFE